MIKEFILNMFGISVTIGVLIVIVALLSPLFQKRYMAKMKYWVWVLVAARLLVPLRLSLMSIEAPVNVPVSDYVVAELPKPAVAEPDVAVPDVAVPQTAQPDADVVTQLNTNVASDNFAAGSQATEPHLSAAEQQTFTETAATETAYSVSVIDIVFWVWPAGTLIYFIYHGAMMLRFRRLLRKATQLSDKSPIYELLQCVKADMGIKNTIGLYLWEEASSPLLIGLFRQKIILPAQQYSNEELEIIFKHELTHSKRHDLWYKALLNIANALHWFNPAVYYMKKCAAKDLEFLCDETVTDGRDFDLRKTYSKLILQGVENKHNKKVPVVSTSLGQDAKIVKQRINGIMSINTKKKGIVALICTIICIALAGNLVACDIEEKTVAATGLYIGGTFYGATKEPEQLEQKLAEFKEPYETEMAAWSEPNLFVKFIREVEFVSGEFTKGDIMAGEDLFEIIKTPVETIYYEAKAGESAREIATKNGISYLEMVNNNANVLDDSHDLIMEDTTLVVAREEAPLRAKIVKHKSDIVTIAFDTIIKRDDSINAAQSYTKVKGIEGEGIAIIEYEYVGGVEIDIGFELSREITKMPVNAEVIVGTKDSGGELGVGTGKMVWPTAEGYRVSRGFYGSHFGIDIVAEAGTEIYAADDGVVNYAAEETVGYGVWIKIDHQNGNETIYAHNQINFVEVGQIVTKGQLIAYMGSSGNSTGTHLHFEVRRLGEKVDPAPYIGYTGPATGE